MREDEDSRGNSYDNVDVFMMYMELLAEVSYYRQIEGGDTSYILLQRVMGDDGFYTDSKRQLLYEKKYPGRRDTLYNDNIVSLNEVMGNIDKFRGRLNPNYFGEYNDDEYENPKSFHKTTASRQFVKDMYLLDKTMVSRVIDNYIYPIARGHIKEKCN